MGIGENDKVGFLLYLQRRIENNLLFELSLLCKMILNKKLKTKGKEMFLVKKNSS